MSICLAMLCQDAYKGLSDLISKNLIERCVPGLCLEYLNIFKPQKGGPGQHGGRVGSPSHLSPPTYLDNFQIVQETHEFNLRFKKRPAGTLQREEFALLTSTTRFWPLYTEQND